MNILRGSILTTAFVLMTFASMRAQESSWSSPENITNNDALDFSPSLDVGPTPVTTEGVHIAYWQFDTKEIFYALKEQIGQPGWTVTQATDRTVTGASNSYNSAPSIKVDPTGFVHIAYQGDFQTTDAEILYIHNTTGSFGAATYITNNTTDNCEPCLGLTGSLVHVAYTDLGGSSSDDDEVWYDDSQVTDNTDCDRTASLVIDAAGVAHIAFAGGGPVTAEIWYAKNTNGSWSITQVTSNDFYDSDPSLAIDSAGHVHIAWQGLTNQENFDIYYANNVSGNFVVTQVTTDSLYEYYPSLVVDPWGCAHIVYQGYTGDPPDETIYYTHNMDGVFTTQLQGPEQVSTDVSTDNKHPSLDIDSNNYLHIAYQGDDGDTEIFYQRTNNPVPVELSLFKAETQGGSVVLSWSTVTESNNYGFEIQRSRVRNSDWVKLGFVKGHGTTSLPHNYTFTDKNLSAGTYYYRLKQINTDGSFDYSEVSEVRVNAPQDFFLSQNYPNPFNPTTIIRYYLPVPSFVTIKVLSLLGEEVRILENAEHGTGWHSVVWDGRNSSEKEVASGVYIFKIYAIEGGGIYSEAKRMLLLR